MKTDKYICWVMNILGWIGIFSSSYAVWLAVGLGLLAINLYCWKTKRLLFSVSENSAESKS